MEALFLKILNMSITATYVLMAVLVLRLLIRRAPKWISYSLWSLVLFRLVCPVSFSSAFSIFGRISKTTSVNNSIEHIPAVIGMTTIPQVDIDPTSVNTVINNALPAASPTASVNPMQTLIFIGTCIWLTGVAVMLIYSVASYLKLEYRMREATLLTGNVFETDKIASPFVCRLIKPRIYLPAGLPEAERGYVLLHECKHIRRRDYLIKPLAFLALSIHWFNPVMWLSFRLMSRDMEMSCDERVARELDQEGRAGYSAALVRLATGRPILAGSPLAFGESGAKGRVGNILNYKKPAFWVTAVAVIACIVAAVFLLANPAKTLELPSASDVSSIDMEQFNEHESLGSVNITNGGDIETVLSALSGARKTLRQSVNDYPIQNNYLVVSLNLTGERKTLCLYTEGNTYYIEEPYVGIYRSNRDASVATYKIYTGSNVQNTYALATAYVFDKCLYVNPSTSYYPIDGTGQLYLCHPDSFTVVNEETGEIQENYSLIDLQANKVDADKWNGMFLTEAVDISGYKTRTEYDIGGKYRLYQMDGEVWLGQFSGDILLRLYRLQETDFSLSDITGRTGSSIPENETLRVDSPNGIYRAEAYGTNKGVTAAGLYPYEVFRVIRNSDETTVWNGNGYYRAEFLWNDDSKYVAIYGEARTYGECFIVEAETGKVIEPPGIDTISAQLSAASQPAENRPDPYFKAVEWVDDTTISVNYCWTAQEGAKEVSGIYNYNIISGDIVANTSQINDSPG